MPHDLRPEAARVHFEPVPLITAPVKEVVHTTPRSRLLTIDLTDRAFGFLPGQAAMVGLHGEQERWPFSIACSPQSARETRCLELLVSLDRNGHGKGHPSHAAVGAQVDMEGPLGTFTFPDEPEQRHILFIAGGLGIAPLRAMLDHALRHGGKRHLAVLYSARRPDEFAFIDELRDHARSGRIELHQTVTRDDGATWDGKHGRLGRGHFETALRDATSTLCFVCGPPQLVNESAAVLSALGVPPESIRSEQWGR